MKTVLTTNDIVLLSFIKDLLGQEGIEHVVLDENMSIMEGSIGALPRRVMVADEDYDQAAMIIASEVEHEISVSSCDVDLSLLSDDKFLGGAINIYQLLDGFRSGIDAVLLAAAVPDLGELRVLDAGCGVGVVTAAIAARCERAEIDGIEIEAIAAKTAEMNMRRNRFDDRVSIVNGDLSERVTKLETLGLRRESYDYVVANPPFFDEGHSITSRNPLKRLANSGDGALLDDWMRFIAAMAKPSGYFLMIHLAHQLPKILEAAQGRFGDLTVYPFYPKEGDAAVRLLVRGRKGAKGPFKLLSGMVLHGGDGKFLSEADAILRGPQTLELD